MRKKILKNSTIVAIGTMISRVLGLARDMLIAARFGTSSITSAFVMAFTLPNMLRDLLGEGAANAAFVPVLTEYKNKNDKKGFWQAANSILLGFTFVILAVVIIGVFIAPFLIKIMAPGFSGQPEIVELTVKFTRMLFPYIFFMALTAYSMGVLNTLGHFMVPSFCRGLLNLSLILSIGLLYPYMGAMCLVVGVLVGGFLQVGVQIPVLKRYGQSFSYGMNFAHPAIKKVKKLMVPRIAGAAVYQINVLFDRMFGSLLWIVGDGAIGALYFSYRLIQLPVGIFSTSFANAVLPTLSENYQNKDMKKFKTNLSFALRSVFFILIPSSLGLILLGKPIISVLFERGLFGNVSAHMTYAALFFYSIGLFAYGGIKILAFSFYSMNDTSTPVRVSARSLVVNIVCNVILMFPLKVGGLALGTSIAGIFNFVFLYAILKKRIGRIKENSIIYFVIKVGIASVIMGVVGFLLSQKFIYASDAGFMFSLIKLLGILIVCLVVYIFSCLLLGLDEIKELKKWISKKK